MRKPELLDTEAYRRAGQMSADCRRTAIRKRAGLRDEGGEESFVVRICLLSRMRPGSDPGPVVEK